MLQTVRSYISNLSINDFGHFYQQYVTTMEDSIIDNDAKQLESKYTSQSDVNEIISNIDTITEELKSL